MKATWEEEEGEGKSATGIKTLIRPDRPDRWTDQIRHIDMYQTRRDNGRVRVPSDPCGEEGNRQVNNNHCYHTRTTDINTGTVDLRARP